MLPLYIIALCLCAATQSLALLRTVLIECRVLFSVFQCISVYLCVSFVCIFVAWNKLNWIETGRRGTQKYVVPSNSQNVEGGMFPLFSVWSTPICRWKEALCARRPACCVALLRSLQCFRELAVVRLTNGECALKATRRCWVVFWYHPHASAIQGGPQKSKPLSRIIIKSY